MIGVIPRCCAVLCKLDKGGGREGGHGVWTFGGRLVGVLCFLTISFFPFFGNP